MNRMNVDADLVAGGSKSFLGGGKGLAGSSKARPPAARSAFPPRPAVVVLLNMAFGAPLPPCLPHTILLAWVASPHVSFARFS